MLLYDITKRVNKETRETRSQWPWKGARGNSALRPGPRLWRHWITFCCSLLASSCFSLAWAFLGLLMWTILLHSLWLASFYQGSGEFGVCFSQGTGFSEIHLRNLRRASCEQREILASRLIARITWSWDYLRVTSWDYFQRVLGTQCTWLSSLKTLHATRTGVDPIRITES